MYFVVFWIEWSATIPSCWLFMESKTFKWPPKPKNPTHLCIKAILPKEDWDTIHYTRFIGPFATYNEARDIEIQAVDISTNDEDALQALATVKVTNNNKPLSVKRAINKPRRLYSSDEENQKSYVKNEKLLKSIKSNSFPHQDEDEDKESDEDSEKGLNSHNVQKNFQKPPIQYIPKNKKKEIISEVAAGVSNSFNNSEENNNLITVPESLPLEYGDLFSQDSFLILKEFENEPINNNVKEYNNETQDMFEVKDDVNNTNQTSTRQNEFDSSQLDNKKIYQLKEKPIIRSIVETNIRLDKNYAHPQTNVEGRNKQHTHEHHDLCCTPCRTDIQAIKKAINSIYLLVLDISEGPRNDTNNLTLNLPITTEKELNDIEILLKEDAVARSQYKKMIKNIGGTTFEKHVRNALTATLIDQMAYKISWTGQKNTISVKEMKFIDLIIETIINCRTDSTIDKIQAVIKSWLQHAGDRLPKEGTKKNKNNLK
ncbi:uncharacterized protein LOC114944866 [Nylanderia fulva]|uniref:uncharacterized protein LOC114944866 n=1 Tax=Nylanderia fulva TaxID=613905 RepID=UPI0010FB2371|nr:uncharacterized protein LOC114944866 [Nylanderia fulva]